MSNPCIRCGKERIEGKTWTVKNGSGPNTVTHIMTICPDRACQKILDKELAERRAKNDLLVKERAEAKLARAKIVAT